ncbi:hypothetical protein [Mycobacterium lepromatosis]|uniref:hypothetical protein n=1 Tax=Mycobacterium lepromatosis TaxID=480418 RepID=UPI000AF2EAD3|nr:hypothetical protein [Mycobacterium lepromatosis]
MQSAVAVREFVAEVGYSVLVKLVGRVGSARIHVLGDADGLKRVLGGRSDAI